MAIVIDENLKPYIRRRGEPVTTPLHELKADFFKTLGHPVRVRVLELLSQREHAVAEMLPLTSVEASALSQHLGLLKKAGLVTSRREGSTVYYQLTSPKVRDLLAVARDVLETVLTGQVELLADLRADVAGAGEG